MISEQHELAARLIAAAGRIEASLYEKPRTLDEISELLRLADAMTSLAENLFKNPPAE